MKTMRPKSPVLLHGSGEVVVVDTGEDIASHAKENDSSLVPSPSSNCLKDIQNKMQTLPSKEIYDVPEKLQTRCHIYNEEMYRDMYDRSMNDADSFWTEMARNNLRWHSNFTKVRQGRMKEGEVAWFLNGKLNACDNCVDRWAEQYPSRPALIWEGDEPDQVKRITYAELKREVCKFANMLKTLGVRKFDTVGLYLPMCPELVYGMLACARIGAVHVVIFAGFSAPNLRDRLIDSNCKVLVTADQGLRGGRELPLKKIADDALRDCPDCLKCIVFKRSGKSIPWDERKDVSGNDVMRGMRPYCPTEIMDSEDLLFLLHTSGSTGKPKGIAHCTAGYLLFAAMTHKYIFDYHPGDVYACVADIGWITGHSYVVYGPLCNGATTVIFESVPTYPDAGRYWSMIERHKVNAFYTAPTAIRALMRFGDEIPKKYDLSSLSVLGSVGEPLNPEAWRWYFGVIGGGKCNIVDTYWQTETGGHMLSPFPGATKPKPGCVGVPFFGVEPALLDPITGVEIKGNSVGGLLVFKRDWPGMMRSIYGDHNRVFKNYLAPFPGYYVTGDGAIRDADGMYWITGRVDDTINVSGHRFGAAEIEKALNTHRGVAESAVVACAHPIKGSGLFCFVVPKKTYDLPATFDQDLKTAVRQSIGPVASPDFIIVADALPKTSSGKIIRRYLRKLAALDFENFESSETLENPEALKVLIDLVKQMSPKPSSAG
eukprot:CAMPEP_0113844498 /NCGR_PEP_ID=MMETSP0372-20130328/268_1 /TAXON_ID=340204 /ORGANISM="Lankesteria abbotti" /LENGTH=712 /DNA_ID=CAMNT_0000813503 /DNA_START=71 /DNA_END=2209 /DNA_ORIENTATION=- /assembly_acc=CAM_ASM_000359